MDKEKVFRMMEMDKLIRDGMYPNCTYFTKFLKVSTRTILRDIDSLKKTFNAPLKYSKSKNGYYYSDLNFSMSNNLLTEGDILSLMIGRHLLSMYSDTPFQKDIQRAYSKLSTFLPDHVDFSENEASMVSIDLYDSMKVKKGDIKHFKTILDAIRESSRIKIEYFSIEDQRKVINVRFEPHQLKYFNGTWYLRGYCKDDSINKTINSKRIIKVRRLNQYFDKKIDSLKMITKSTEKDNVLVKAVFKKKIADLVAEKLWNSKKEYTYNNWGDLEASFYSEDIDSIYHWLLSFGPDVKILEPAHLRLKIRKDLLSMVALY